MGRPSISLVSKVAALAVIMAIGAGHGAIAEAPTTSAVTDAALGGMQAVVTQSPPNAATIKGGGAVLTEADARVIYGWFARYRKSLAFDSSNPSVFFSRTWNDFNLNWVINYRSPDDGLETLRAVRAKYRFGRVVDFVHAISASDLGTDSRLLRIVASSRRDPKQRPIEIQFVREEGEWRIDDIAYFLPMGDPIVSVIDSFPVVAD
jgi:hypothetical protein